MLRLEHIVKTYRGPDGVVTALDDVSLEVAAGQFVALCGPSCSGKTTLLMTAAGLLRPSAGSVRVGNADVYSMAPGPRARFRAESIGVVFQLFCLIPYLSVLDNVLLAGVVTGRQRDREAAREALCRLGLEHRLRHKPSALSAGEQQRTAVARAMFNKPKLLLADEPTGNLDADNAAIVLDALRAYAAANNAVLMVTHSETAAAAAMHEVHLKGSGFRVQGETEGDQGSG